MCKNGYSPEGRNFTDLIFKCSEEGSPRCSKIFENLHLLWSHQMGHLLLIYQRHHEQNTFGKKKQN